MNTRKPFIRIVCSIFAVFMWLAAAFFAIGVLFEPAHRAHRLFCLAALIATIPGATLFSGFALNRFKK